MGPTLKRFFLFHFQLPFLLCGFVVLHPFYLHFLSSNNPLRNSTNNKIPFFPFIFLKDLFGLILILCLYFLQTHFGISSLSHPDNALEACALLTPLHIVPEWYFLCQYAMLKAVPNKNAGFIVLLTSIFTLFFFELILSFHFWFRDLLREFAKKYEVLLIIFFLVFFLFLASEGLLFVSFFWASFHSLSSLTLGICPVEGFYLPDPCELTFSNTLLLSNADISLGNAFISLEISSQFLIFFSLFSFILAWTFISLQIKEFRIMGLSINDSVYS